VPVFEMHARALWISGQPSSRDIPSTAASRLPEGLLACSHYQAPPVSSAIQIGCMSGSGPRRRLKPGVRPTRTRHTEARRHAAKEGVVQADSARWRPPANQIDMDRSFSTLPASTTFDARPHSLVVSSEARKLSLVGNSCFRLVANSWRSGQYHTLSVNCIAGSEKGIRWSRDSICL
jgi:hypothetical protein